MRGKAFHFLAVTIGLALLSTSVAAHHGSSVYDTKLTTYKGTVTDSESTDRDGYGHNPGWKRGIRIGSAKDGKVTAYIPDPDPKGGSSMSEGVAVDHQGNVYGAEVGPKDLKKYVKN